MTSIDSLFSRALLIVTALAIALGIVGNLAPGVVAKAAGYALFGIVLASPGIAVVTSRQAVRRLGQRPPRAAAPSRRAAGIVGLAILAVIGAIVMPFAVVAIGKIIGEPGSERYPDTATRVLLISLMGMPVVVAFAFLLWQSRGPKRHYRTGRAKLAAGQLLPALEQLEVYKRRRPRDPAGWEATASILVSLGKLEEGLAHANEALKLAWRWQGLLARGLVLFHLGAINEALRDLEESASLSRNPIVESVLGSVLGSLRRLEAAITLLKASYARVRWAPTLLALGEAYRLRGMRVVAELFYEEAAGMSEGASHPSGGAVRAYSLAQLGRADEAIEAADSVLKGDAARELALSAHALASLRRGDLATVEENLGELANRYPHWAVQALMDPEFSALLANDRFKRLLDAAMRARDEQVNRARHSLAAGPRGSST